MCCVLWALILFHGAESTHIFSFSVLSPPCSFLFTFSVHLSGIRSWDTNLIDCNLDQELKLFVSRHSARFSADVKGRLEIKELIVLCSQSINEMFIQFLSLYQDRKNTVHSFHLTQIRNELLISPLLTLYFNTHFLQLTAAALTSKHYKRRGFRTRPFSILLHGADFICKVREMF